MIPTRTNHVPAPTAMLALLLGLVTAATTPAQVFGATATGTLSASGGTGSTPQTYSGAITPPGASTSSGGWWGSGSSRVTFGSSSMVVDLWATDAGSASASIVLVLDAPLDAGVRVNASGWASLIGGYSVVIDGSTYSDFGAIDVDVLVPAGGLPITISGRASGYPFAASNTMLDVSWSYPGVTTAGSATPGCLGDAVAWTRGVPTLGNSTFGITCANAHPLRGGVSVIGLGGLSTPVVYDAVDLWVDPNLPLATLYIPSNSAGEILHPLAIPGHSSFVGLSLFAQWLLLEPGGCTPLGLSGSNAIRITVQP